MRTSIILRVLLVAAAVASALVVAAPAAEAARPLRKGRILSGVFTTGPAGPCSWQPDCIAWRASGCHPALAGADPAWLTSIVDVRELADGVTDRVFEYGPGRPVGVDPGGVFIEFWT